MERQDKGMGTLLQYENVAWYENGAVRILDRRVYPYRKEFVTCTTYQQVAQAITDMVTQSYGPFHAAAMGMALAAYECREKSAAEQRAYLKAAADVIANARPTTARKMRTAHLQRQLQGCRSFHLGNDHFDPDQLAHSFRSTGRVQQLGNG